MMVGRAVRDVRRDVPGLRLTEIWLASRMCLALGYTGVNICEIVSTQLHVAYLILVNAFPKI